MLAARSAIATPATAAALMIPLALMAAVVLVIMLLIALLVTLVPTLGSILLLLRLSSRGSAGGGRRLGRSGDESGRVIGALSWWRRWRLAAGRLGVGWLAHTRSGNRIGANPFIGSVTIRIGFALLLLTAKGARPTAATMGTSTFVHAPVLVCGRASTAQ